MKVKTKKDRRERIRLRQRRRLRGTPDRPRLAVVRSLAHISAQAIDDEGGRTLASASSMESNVKAAFADGAGGGNMAGAQVVGRLVAERLLQQGVKRVVFDRGGVLYHGRVRSVADAAREAGLEL
ncbi:MAG: 50S ribosomal protein L18 [Acidobacteria bacterium]|nr:50S ribosomal protein L18 [Acidobacteriota bacterium]MCY4658199.1 50S ribosomal protein L18 [Acidobacteriota bacterium]